MKCSLCLLSEYENTLITIQITDSVSAVCVVASGSEEAYGKGSKKQQGGQTITEDVYWKSVTDGQTF